MIFRRLHCQNQAMTKVVKTYICQRIFIRIKCENQKRKKETDGNNSVQQYTRYYYINKYDSMGWS